MADTLSPASKLPWTRLPLKVRRGILFKALILDDLFSPAGHQSYTLCKLFDTLFSVFPMSEMQQPAWKLRQAIREMLPNMQERLKDLNEILAKLEAEHMNAIHRDDEPAILKAYQASWPLVPLKDSLVGAMGLLLKTQQVVTNLLNVSGWTLPPVQDLAYKLPWKKLPLEVRQMILFDSVTLGGVIFDAGSEIDELSDTFNVLVSTFPEPEVREPARQIFCELHAWVGRLQQMRVDLPILRLDAKTAAHFLKNPEAGKAFEDAACHVFKLRDDQELLTDIRDDILAWLTVRSFVSCKI